MAAAAEQSSAPRRLGFPDIEALKRLSVALNWPHTHEDWQTILLSGMVYGVRAVDGPARAEIDACAALFPYGSPGGPNCCVLGMVMVAPHARRRGLGQRVVQHCLDARSPATVPVYLASTAQGLALYEGLGFRPVGHLSKMLADGPLSAPCGQLPSDWTIQDNIAMADFGPVLTLDRAAFGASRDGFLKHRIGQAAAHAGVRDVSGNLVGFGLAVRQGDLLIVGPIAVADDRAVLALVHHLAQGHDGPIRIDVPDSRPALPGALEALGFRLTEQPPVMALGGAGDAAGLPGNGLPGNGWRDYAAISAQAFL